MRSRPNPIYRLLHKDYHESFDAYVPQQSDFYDRVMAMLPQNWQIVRQGIWYCCGSVENMVPRQGWKIHLSATLANAHEVLSRVLAVLFRRGDTDFKFALDMSTLFLLNSKNWSRGGSGKFITIYPGDNEKFLDIIEELHEATKDLQGPYILSDHRYKDSRVVFYRYGGMKLHTALHYKGERIPMLVRPDGTEEPDERLPYPSTPSWAGCILSPESNEQEASTEDSTLRNGRYEIQSALEFSNAGGVYLALDRHTGMNVVVKEARPFVNETTDGYNAVELLKKEFQILTVLADARIAPQPVELFQEWEHWFLVEEYIEGTPMSAHAAHSLLLRTRPDSESCMAWYETFRALAGSLADVIRTLHSRNVVFADLSPNNLIIPAGTTELKLIDFEGAYRVGVDLPTKVYTPGFASQGRLRGESPSFQDDYYSLGAVLLAHLLPVNGIFHLQPAAKQQILQAIQDDGFLPPVLVTSILNLMQEDASQRPCPAELAQVLESADALPARTAAERVVANYGAVVDGIVAHMEAAASYERKDRLFPADPKVFTTNPLSLAYGATGVAYAMAKVTGKLPEKPVDWILKHKITSTDYAPSLYLGTSGIAWSLLEMGATTEAEKIFSQTKEHPLLHNTSDLFYGTAGWGMANLRFFQATNSESYLTQAMNAGDRLIQPSDDPEFAYTWEGSVNRRIGLAHGGSGVALFLSYLYGATGIERYITAAKDALDRDLSFGIETEDGGISFAEAEDAPSPVYPYWRYGSAGIGVAALRLAKISGEKRYYDALGKIFIDTDRKYAVFPGKFVGLTGMGDFLLDMYDATRDRKYLESAFKVAEGIMYFRVDRHGIAFPGDMLSRLCCDYGTGSASIALFLNRLMGRQGNDFLLDSLLGAFKPAGYAVHEEPADMTVLTSRAGFTPTPEIV